MDPSSPHLSTIGTIRVTSFYPRYIAPNRKITSLTPRGRRESSVRPLPRMTTTRSGYPRRISSLESFRPSPTPCCTRTGRGIWNQLTCRPTGGSLVPNRKWRGSQRATSNWKVGIEENYPCSCKCVSQLEV